MRLSKEKQVDFAAGAAVVIVFGVMVLGFVWLLWLLWTWVLPQIWPTGPAGLIRPGYFLFLGMWFLASVIFKMIIGRAK